MFSERDDIAIAGSRLPSLIVTEIPESDEFTSSSPYARAHALCEEAAKATAKISGKFALTPGPVGLSTLIPDMMAMWEIQRQLVADIASVYGRSSSLGREQMLWCLVKHSAVQTFRDVLYRTGERVFTHPLSLRFMRKLATVNGLHVSPSDMGRAVSSFLPLVGASAVTWYAYRDTKRVGAAAIALFDREITFENEA